MGPKTLGPILYIKAPTLERPGPALGPTVNPFKDDCTHSPESTRVPSAPPFRGGLTKVPLGALLHLKVRMVGFGAARGPED